MKKYIDSFKVFEAREQWKFERSEFKPTDVDMLRREIDKMRAARSAKQKTPEDLQADATSRVLDLFPRVWKSADVIKSVTDQSDDQNGIKFQFDMVWGDTLHLVKNENVYGKWDVYLNGKMMRSPIYGQIPELMKKIKPLDHYLFFVPSYDSTWDDSTDSKARELGNQEQDNLRSLYAKLSTGDKRKAYKAFKDKFKTEIDFTQFTGA